MRPKRRALVVEDDEATRSLVQNFLEYEGFVVDTAAEPTEIQNLEAYTLILLDIHFGIGRANGLHWMDEQRTSGRVGSETTIIFTTGYRLDELVIAPYVHVLPKPIELTSLRKLIPEVT